MLEGSWWWCKSHQVVEFISRYSFGPSHELIGPYPTKELAEEFGDKVWGFDNVV